MSGLVPRGALPDLSRLRAKNRVDMVPATPGETQVSTFQPAASDSDARVVRGEAAASVAADRSEPAPPPGQTGSVSVTTYMRRSVRARARAAFKATAHLEDDVSWSAFIEAAVLREVVRREGLYNAGEEYPGDERKLAPGRSVR